MAKGQGACGEGWLQELIAGALTMGVGKLLIARGRTDGLREKIDMLFALDRLNTEQYEELCGLLPTVG